MHNKIDMEMYCPIPCVPAICLGFPITSTILAAGYVGMVVVNAKHQIEEIQEQQQHHQ